MPYSYYRAITISAAQTGGSDLTDFPVVVAGTYPWLATVANGGLVTNANGYDVAFFADAGLTTKLNWEVELYTAATGEVIYWVQVPTVSGSVNTTFYIAYGNSAVTTDQSNTAGTWNGPPYAGVWHLNTSGGSVVVSESANNITSTNNGTTAATGIIPGSGAASFSPFGGGGLTYINVTDGTGGPLDLSRSFSMSAWLNPTSGDYGFKNVFSHCTPLGAGGYDLYLTNSPNYTPDFSVSNGNNIGTANSALSTGAWSHVVATISAGSTFTVTFYINGVAAGTASASDSFNNSANPQIGADNTSNGFFGLISEMRIVGAVLSQAWITTEYNNQSSPSTFYSVGSQQSNTSFVEDDSSFWLGLRQIGSAALLGASFALATGLPTVNYHQDEVAPAQVHLDEDYRYTAPASSVLQFGMAYLPDTGDDPAATLHGQPDEDYWQNPTAPVPLQMFQSLPLGDTEELPAGSLFGQADEDYWQNRVPPVQSSFSQRLPLGDQEEVSAGYLYGQPDEDYWQNSVASVPLSMRWPSPWSFDQDEQYAGLSGLPEEDFWVNPVSPVRAGFWQRLPLGDPEEIPTTLPYSQPDEDLWINPVMSVPGNLYQRLPFVDVEEIPAASLSGQSDEDFWNVPVPSQSRQNIGLPIVDADYVFQVSAIDEDFWIVPLPVSSSQNFIVSVVDSDYALQVLSVDEDVWQNPVPVAQAQFTQSVWLQDDVYVPGSVVDEDVWQVGVAVLGQSNVTPKPWMFDADYPAPAVSQTVVDEDFWINQASVVSASMQWMWPWGFDDSFAVVGMRRVFLCENWVVTDALACGTLICRDDLVSARFGVSDGVAAGSIILIL